MEVLAHFPDWPHVLLLAQSFDLLGHLTMASICTTLGWLEINKILRYSPPKAKITQEKMQKNLCLPFHDGIQASLLSTFNSPILQKKGESIGQLCSGWVWKSCGKKTKLGKKHLQYAWKSIPYSKPEKMPKSMSRVILMMSSSQFSGFLDLSAFLRGLVCLIFHPYIWIGIHKITYSYP